MFNNEYFIQALCDREELTIKPGPEARERLRSDLCLLLRLPNDKVLQREGENSGLREELRQLRRSPSPPFDDDGHALESPPHQRQRTVSQSSSGSIPRIKKSQPFYKEPPGYEVLRAVETKDIMFLMEIRDRAFHLLLRKTGDVTPLLHAMRIGSSHRDVAILLLGALSRWVNHLDESDLQQSKTKPLLKVLRTNLRLAIDYGLQQSQSDLLASFMQTLVMSEGDRWVVASCSAVATALQTTEGKPVSTADGLVRKFATRELGKADLIASLEEYIANATADLVMMAIWSIASEKLGGDSIPAYCFARDQRVYKSFEDRINENKTQLSTLTRRLKWQIRVALKVFEGRADSYRRKVELAVQELDSGIRL